MADFIFLTIILFVFFVVINTYDDFKKRSNMKKEALKGNQKKYVLNVITKHDDGGVSSHWHGWSSQWLFTHDEALVEKEKIKDFFSEVEIIEHEVEQREIKQVIEEALDHDKSGR